MKENMVNVERILKDCFWDMKLTITDIEQMANGDDFRKKAFLFEKILINSTCVLIDLQIFNKTDLQKLIENFKIPSFNYDYVFRRKNIVEVYFFDRPLKVNELKWRR